MKKHYSIALLIMLICTILPFGWAIAIDWIQSTERVVGEGHPTYTDVVNRPMKQIWGVYTSQHSVTGLHTWPTPLPTATPVVIPTPLPTATPIPANNRIDWTNATANFMTTGTVDFSPAAAIKPKLYYQSTAPDITTDSFAFWVDSYSNQFWLILDRGDTQKKVELLP